MKWDYSLDFGNLADRYARGAATPTSVAKEVLARTRSYRDQHVYTYILPEQDIFAQARAVEERRRREGDDALPLYGLPFAVKDNIHVAGYPTACACAASARRSSTRRCWPWLPGSQPTSCCVT